MNGLRQIFFFGSGVLQLFCHKVQATNAILSVVKNKWNRNFSDSIDLQEKNRFGRSYLNILNLLAIYCWQLSNSSQLSTYSSVYLRDFTNLFYKDVFSISFDKYLFICRLRKAYGVVWSNRLAMLLVQRDVLYNAFDLIDESFENINSIFRTFFQEPQDVLIFTVSVTIYISSVKE